MVGLEDLPSDYLFDIILVHFPQCKAYFNNPKFIDTEKRIDFINKGFDFNSINLDSILRVAIFAGKYNPIALYNLKFLPIILQMDDTITMVKYDQQRLHYIDSVRQYYGLCNMELNIKKGLYDLKSTHFRPKRKSESVNDYVRNSIPHERNTDFNFGVFSVFSMYMTDKDKDHSQFNEQYTFFLKNPFNNRPSFSDFTPFTKDSFKDLDIKINLNKNKN